MNLPKTSRRRFLQAGGAGLLNFAVPGLVVGKDKFNDAGNAVFRVHGRVFSLGNSLDLQDMQGETLAHIQQKLMAGIDKTALQKDIAKAVTEPGFNLYAFVENYL